MSGSLGVGGVGRVNLAASDGVRPIVPTVVLSISNHILFITDQKLMGYALTVIQIEPHLVDRVRCIRNVRIMLVGAQVNQLIRDDIVTGCCSS